jgi:DNA-binding transcriptional regulator YiaG
MAVIGQFEFERTKLGLNFPALSKAAKVAVGTIHRWENGQTKVTPHNYKKLKEIGFTDSALLNPTKEITID